MLLRLIVTVGVANIFCETRDYVDERQTIVSLPSGVFKSHHNHKPGIRYLFINGETLEYTTTICYDWYAGVRFLLFIPLIDQFCGDSAK